MGWWWWWWGQSTIIGIIVYDCHDDTLRSSLSWRVLSDQEYFQLKSCSRLNVFGLESSLSCFKSTWMNEFERVVKCSFRHTSTLASFKWSQKSQTFLYRQTVTVTRSKFVKRERDDCSTHSGQHFLITDQTLKLLNFLPFKLFSLLSLSLSSFSLSPWFSLFYLTSP